MPCIIWSHFNVVSPRLTSRRNPLFAASRSILSNAVMNDQAHQLLSSVVLATGNQGKVGEFAELLSPLNITVRPQS